MSLPGHLIEVPLALAAGRIFVHRRKARLPTQTAPLVLLHGYLMSHFAFVPVIECLSEHRDLVLLDLPGHGESDRPSPIRFAYDLPSMAQVVVGVLDALSIPRAALLGHSFGGATALTVAARYPDRCERLVVVDGAIYPSPLPWEARLALLPIVGPIVFRELYRKSDLRRIFLREFYRDPALVTDDRVDYYWERINRGGGRDAMHACLMTLGTLLPDNPDVARVRAPTLLVWGEEDRSVPLYQGKRLARAMKTAQLEVIPACGHNPFEERPEEFCAAVVPFLNSAEVRKEGDVTADPHRG